MAATRRRSKVDPQSKGLAAGETLGAPPKPIQALLDSIGEDGAAVLASYREPLGGHWLVLAALPVEQVEATPYQRDLSDTHLRRLTDVIERVGMFLDPIIATREGERRYWTPNGHHRLAALRKLGIRTVIALVVSDREVATKILALNTEKSHNLKEKSLEVIRMARALAQDSDRAERDFALEFEEPVLLTLGPCYEHNARFAGGSYRPPLLRVEQFSDAPLAEALTERERRSAALLALDAEVGKVVAALQERGLRSPYLRPFVVARINPLRFKKDVAITADELITAMHAAARAFDVGKVRQDQITAVGGSDEE